MNMCSPKQSKNPYLVYIDHFSDLDEGSDDASDEFNNLDELDDLNQLDEECAVCGCEAVDCACNECEGHDSKDNDSVNPKFKATEGGILGWFVRPATLPLAMVAKAAASAANSVGKYDKKMQAQSGDDAIQGKLDVRRAAFVLDLRRDEKGFLRLLNLGQSKDIEDQRSIDEGNKGTRTSWSWWNGHKWALTDLDRIHIKKDFQIINLRNKITQQFVKDHPLLDEVAHKVIRSSVLSSWWKGIRKKTYREAMNELYKVRSRFDENEQKILDRWWRRDHFVFGDKKDKADWHEVHDHRKLWKHNELQQHYNEKLQQHDADVAHKQQTGIWGKFRHGSHTSNPPNPSYSLSSSHNSRASTKSRARSNPKDDSTVLASFHKSSESGHAPTYHEIRVPRGGGSYSRHLVPSFLLSKKQRGG